MKGQKNKVIFWDKSLEGKQKVRYSLNIRFTEW